MKVSVILPSLNVKEYIRECIESVINQTLKEIEIICIDAGSTDGTLEILREYAQKDNRIKVFVSEMKSYGHQMNLGMKMATGEYIGIVETDDYVPSEMYEELYDIAKKNDVDFVKADFYRFTGKEQSLSKAYYKLSQQQKYYNRVIDISITQECFNFVMNTWSGIYKKAFIENHKITHNETPGASYQDNGFWFQTFMYAKRAYFVEKPYYMNRRDNEHSSVFSKGKVYCICDEYRFIYDIMRKRQEIIDVFGFTFGLACFRAYKNNLNRISDEYKREFIRRWSADFRFFRDEGLLDFRRFNEVDWDMILNIINDPDTYYENEILKEQEFYEEVKKHKNIIIYGAGMIGHRVLDKLVYSENPADVISFAVSKKEENLSDYKGIPIKSIYDLFEYKEDGFIIIATTARYQDEIAEMLMKLEFTNVIAVPDIVRKDEKYYKSLSLRERIKELEKWYLWTTGEELCLDNPQSFNEKQQWMKIYDNTEIKRYLVDKANMRTWIREMIGEKYLPRIVGIYADAKDIPYNELPNQFILKCTHGCRMNTFVEDKNDTNRYNWDVIVRKINSCLKMNYAYSMTMETFYKDAKPQVMVELPVEGVIKQDNYKVICIKGKPRCVVHDRSKLLVGRQTRDVFDLEWRHIDVKIKYPNASIEINKPRHFNEMLRIAEKICEGFDFVIIHLFDTESGVKFNEISFGIGSGVEKIVDYDNCFSNITCI